MSKQTELRALLDALLRAVRSGNERTAYVAEQNIFSLFADLKRALQSTRNLAAERLHEIKRMHDKHAEEIKASRVERDKAMQERYEAHRALERVIRNEPQPQPQPFDLEAAKRGEPIEVMMASDNWIEKQFVGKFIDGRGVPMVVYIHGDRPDWAPIHQVRMKAPEQLTAYVNAYRTTNGTIYFGVSSSEDDAIKCAADYRNGTVAFAVAAPVKITVNK